MYKTGSLIACLIVCIACGAPRSTGHGNASSPATQALHLDPGTATHEQIVFLTFDLSVDSMSDACEVSLKQSRFMPGHLKTPVHATDPAPEPFHLYIALSDDRNVRKAWIRVSDPTQMLYEFPADGGQLVKKVITKPSGTFTIRFQHDPSFAYLSIYKATPPPHALKQIYHAAL